MAKQVTQHAVVGTGNDQVTATALQEALKDALAPGDVVGLVWQKPIPRCVEVVYDYALDNDVSFVMFHTEDSSPPRAFRESEHGSVQKTRSPLLTALGSITGSGKVLFLWNDEENPDPPAKQLIEQVFNVIDEGVLVLELTGGLQPIRAMRDVSAPTKNRYDDDEEDVLSQLVEEIGEPGQEDEVPPAEPDEQEYTREELLNMPAPVVKRYGERKQMTATTKTGIINELFPLDEVSAQPPATQVTGVAAPDGWALFDRSLREIVRDRQEQEILTCYGLAKSLAWGVMEQLPVSRERSLALTRIEEALMWAVQGVLLTAE